MFPFVPSSHHIIRPSSTNSHGGSNTERNFWSIWTGDSECSNNKSKKSYQKLNNKSQRVVDSVKTNVSATTVGCYASEFIPIDTKTKSIGALDSYSTYDKLKKVYLSTRESYLKSDENVPEHTWIKHLKYSMDTHSNNVILELSNNEICVRTIRNINVNEEIELWFSEEILATMYIPFLTPANIREEELNACGVSIENDDDLIDHEENEDLEDEIENDNSQVALVEEGFHEDMNSISSLTGELMLKDYGVTQDDSTGNTKTVRKSTLLWVLASNPEKLSSDRLERVKISEIKSRAARVVTTSSIASMGFQFFRREEEILIGEWCLFHIEEQLMIGLIVGFKYLSGKNNRDTKYSKQYVLVKIPEGTKPRGIGVLATWHKLKREKSTLSTAFEFENKKTDDSSDYTPTVNAFLDILITLATVEKPSFTNDGLKLKNFQMSDVLEITPYLKKDPTTEIKPVARPQTRPKNNGWLKAQF